MSRETSVMASGGTTAIVNGLVIAHDGEDVRRLDDGVVVMRGDKIIHVGKTYTGHVDRKIDAAHKFVIPGQISTHAHVSAHDAGRQLLEGGRRDFFRTGFLNYVPTKLDGGPSLWVGANDEATWRYGLASLIRHGITTVVAVEGAGGDSGATFARLIGEYGIRAYYAPAASAVDYFVDSSGRLVIRPNETKGLQGLERIQAFAEEHHGAYDGRFQAMIVLDEFYKSSPRVLREAGALADVLGLRWTMHFSEQLMEFMECVREHGLTPLEYMDREGLLSDRLLLAHCIYVGGHSAVSYPYDGDLEILAMSGASVAHSPLALMRRGLKLESFDRYLQAGVRMSFGTDVFPLDMFGEMRAGSLACKLHEGRPDAGDAGRIFRTATLGGAAALGRNDIGRIQTGAKADLVLLDINSLSMGVVADPLRTLVHLATPDAVDTVICDGRMLMEEKRLLVGVDQDETIRAARRNAEMIWSNFPRSDWAGRTVQEIFPPTIENWYEDA